jgi:hypothetical protein
MKPTITQIKLWAMKLERNVLYYFEPQFSYYYRLFSKQINKQKMEKDKRT